MVKPFEGDETPEAAEDTASEFGCHVFYMSDAARWTRPKHSRTRQLVAINNQVYNREDAALTYSHEDKCFYVVHVPGATQLAQTSSVPPSSIAIYIVEETQKGNNSYKKLSREHQAEFDKSRKKEGDSLTDAGAVRVLSLAESH